MVVAGKLRKFELHCVNIARFQVVSWSFRSLFVLCLCPKLHTVYCTSFAYSFGVVCSFEFVRIRTSAIIQYHINKTRYMLSYLWTSGLVCSGKTTAGGGQNASVWECRHSPNNRFCCVVIVVQVVSIHVSQPSMCE